MMNIQLMAAGLMAGLGCTLFAAPEITITACAPPPRIDGVLTDACWQSAAQITNFSLLTPVGDETAASPTTVRMTFDDSWLYLAFSCAHPYPSAVKPKVLKRDGPIQEDESIELFLRVGANSAKYSATYYHFGLNAANVRMDQRIKNGQRDRGWDCPWRSAVRLEDAGWAAEIAVPWCALVPEGSVGAIGMNIARNMVLPEFDTEAVLIGKSCHTSVWSELPRDASLHEPKYFGLVRGAESLTAKMPFLPLLVQANVTGFQSVAGGYGYGVVVELANESSVSGAVTVSVADQPGSGSGAEIQRTVALAGLTTNRLCLEVPVKTLDPREVQVTLRNATSGELLDSRQFTDRALFSILAATADRSYYTTEAEGRIICDFSCKPDMFTNALLLARLPDGRELNRVSLPQTRLPYSLKDISEGVHTLVLELRVEDVTLLTQSVPIVKKKPKPGFEVKIDRENRVLLREGQPSFVYGLVASDIKAEDEAAFRDIAGMGFGNMVHWGRAVATNAEPATEILPFCEMARKYNLSVVATMDDYYAGTDTRAFDDILNKPGMERLKNHFKTSKASNVNRLKSMLGGFGVSVAMRSKIFAACFEQNLPRLEQAIRSYAGQDNVTAFQFFDEPPSKRQFPLFIQGCQLHDRIMTTDGYHPTVVLFHLPEEYSDWNADIMGTDPYVVPPGSLNYVSAATAKVKKYTDALRKVALIWPLAEFRSGPYKRPVLPREQRCQTYLAIIYGAKVLGYFRYPFIHQATYDGFRDLTRELAVLGPIAVTPDIPQHVEYSEGKVDPDLGSENYSSFPPVSVCLRRAPDGRAVLLAANSQPYPLEVVFHLSCLDKKGKIESLFPMASGAPEGERTMNKNLLARWFSGPDWRYRDGAFNDRLEAFDVRSYVLDACLSSAAPVEIHVVTKPAGSTNGLEVFIPMSGVPGKKNVARNGGFETCTLPDLPDYYAPVTAFSGERIGSSNGVWKLDPLNPWQGRYALSIKAVGPRLNGFGFYSLPQSETATNYVFSIYARADHAQAKLELSGNGFATKVFDVTREWRRYWIVGQIPARPRWRQDGYFYVAPVSTGVFWVDGLQIEKGKEPTEFEP